MNESGIEKMLNENHIVHTFYTVSETAEKEPDLEKSELFEIELIVEGDGVHYIDGNWVPCKAGDIYFVCEGVPHRYFSARSEEPLVIRKLIFTLKDWLKGDAAVLDSKHYCYGVFDEGAHVAYAMLNSSMRERVTSIFDAIEWELEDKESEWKAIVRTYLVQLFAFLARYLGNSIKNAPKKDFDAAVFSAIRIIDSEFMDSELSLESISKRVFASTSQLSRNFKIHTGRLFSEYLREVRLKHSLALLTESDMSVENIVEESGFRDSSAFYRNFRETFGMTPQVYRQVSEISKKSEKIVNEREKRKMEILNEISLNVQNGKSKIVKELVQQAVDAGAVVEEILKDGLLAGMSVVGEKFKNNEVYVPEVLVAARAMSMGMEILRPLLIADGVKATGRVCIGTVQGDLHDIGKNLVKMMMEGKGLEVIDLGTDVAPETFVQTAIEQDCKVICCSALLTTTMDVMADVVKAAEAAGIRDKVKIMVGGAPVNEEFCQKIGADSYTVDAASAADAAVAFFK